MKNNQDDDDDDWKMNEQVHWSILNITMQSFNVYNVNQIWHVTETLQYVRVVDIR